MLVLAVGAVMGGADGWEAIAAEGQAPAEWFAQRLALPHGMPSHATFRRVLSRLAPEALTPCGIAWPGALRDLSGGASGSSDGHTRRHACEQATSPAARHLVRAWANAKRLVCGQGKVEDKAQAIPALPPRLKRREVAGAPVPSEAMGCQKDRARVLTAQQAASVWARKAQPPPLSAAVTLWLDAAQASALAALAPADQETVEGAQGRLDTRRYGIPSALEGCGATASWSHLPRRGRVESRRDMGHAVESATRSCFPSLPADGGRFAHAVRQHWGSEHA